MKTTLVTIAFVLLLFLQFAQVGEVQKLQRRLNGPAGDAEQLRGYLDLVDHYSSVTNDPARAGAAAVVYTKELTRAMPPEAAIDYYDKLLPDVKNESVRRAIRFELVELYTRGPRPDRAKAMEQLRILMTAAP